MKFRKTSFNRELEIFWAVDQNLKSELLPFTMNEIFQSMQKTLKSIERLISLIFLRSSPVAQEYLRNFEKYSSIISDSYRVYINEVSTDKMAVSHEIAVLLLFLCDFTQPETILDLGSGFSSFVFRLYAQMNDKASVKVISVDDNEDWLKLTRDFLNKNNLSAEGLITMRELDQLPDPFQFDLVFHDLGNMETRKETLKTVLGRVKTETGILILDDMHKKHYETYVIQEIRKIHYGKLNLKPILKDKFGRYCWLLTEIKT